MQKTYYKRSEQHFKKLGIWFSGIVNVFLFTSMPAIGQPSTHRTT